mmetsp:Transcript_26516/g.63606  ORF Transcript_26516/g.63606 Transcript_26516/m.63606 type:complete len:276 (-) Transcript_26516:336-1163(-)
MRLAHAQLRDPAGSIPIPPQDRTHVLRHRVQRRDLGPHELVEAVPYDLVRVRQGHHTLAPRGREEAAAVRQHRLHERDERGVVAFQHLLGVKYEWPAVLRRRPPRVARRLEHPLQHARHPLEHKLAAIITLVQPLGRLDVEDRPVVGLVHRFHIPLNLVDFHPGLDHVRLDKVQQLVCLVGYSQEIIVAHFGGTINIGVSHSFGGRRLFQSAWQENVLDHVDDVSRGHGIFKGNSPIAIVVVIIIIALPLRNFGPDLQVPYLFARRGYGTQFQPE